MTTQTGRRSRATTWWRSSAGTASAACARAPPGRSAPASSCSSSPASRGLSASFATLATAGSRCASATRCSTARSRRGGARWTTSTSSTPASSRSSSAAGATPTRASTFYSPLSPSAARTCPLIYFTIAITVLAKRYRHFNSFALSSPLNNMTTVDLLFGTFCIVSICYY